LQYRCFPKQYSIINITGANSLHIFSGELNMQKALNQFILLLVVLAVVLTSAVRTTTVYADDGDTEPVTEEVTEPVVEEEQPAPPSEEEVAAEEPVSVPEILEQLPEDTELVVVNEEGEVEPLASEEAAEIIETADPMWCPEGATPGDAGCTSSFGDFASLIAALAADAASATPVYTGNGVVWVEDTYNGNDDSQIIFDGAILTNLNNSNLTVQGGWSGGNNTTVTGTSLADVSMVFVNWTGNITINDLDIAAGDDAGFGLSIQNDGDVNLSNVSVNGSTENSYGFGDGAVIDSTGNVDINNSEFDNNEGNGLTVASGGTISLDTVSASSNTLTGAFLDSCGYGDITAGLCAGSGVVTVNSGASLFNNNGFNGLVIDAGGGIAVANVQANNNALNGAVLTSADDDGTGNVSVDQSEFNGNSNGNGLDILGDGSIDVANVDAFTNNTGAILIGDGVITISNSNFGIDALTGNDWTGLHAESGSDISLTDVIASYNGNNGAYLEAEGNITITDSTFDENVNVSSPADPGLYANSNGGNISLTNVNANSNDYGAGVVLETNGAGSINVTGGNFDSNGSFGIQAKSENGDITLDGVTASLNAVKGAYLNAYGTGNIFVNNSVFIENGSYGIYAGTSEGNISLDLVTVTGNDVTGTGAALVTGTGSVFVSDSSFDLNTAVGLWVVSGGAVDLVNVTADGNGGNGVEVYSTSTAEAICPEDEVISIPVTVDAGVFTNNGEYGLMVKPGPLGTLTFTTPSTFGGNILGDYLLDVSDPESKDCTPKEEEPTETKEPLVVEVPSTGGTPVEQDCEIYSGTILKLPNGTWMKVGCPYEGFSLIEELSEEQLPGQLGAGTDFAGGVNVSLLDGEGNVILNEDGTVTINFLIPEDSRARGYSILFWDPTLNDGTSFPLNPDNLNDRRTIVSGVQQVGNIVTVTVNFSGMFVLVER
jgi:hypothetical protein